MPAQAQVNRKRRAARDSQGRPEESRPMSGRFAPVVSLVGPPGRDGPSAATIWVTRPNVDYGLGPR